MKTATLLAFIAAAPVAVMASSFTPNMCTTGTLATYIALGSQGCQLGPGGYTFRSFGFSTSQSTTSPVTADPTTIVVTPSGRLNNMSLSMSSSAFMAPQGSFAQYFIDYIVDPPPPEIIRFDDSLATDPPIFADLLTQIDDLDHPCDGPCFTLEVTDQKPGASVSFAPTTGLSISNTLTLDGTQGTAQIAGFTQTAGANPEPSTVILFGTGLLVCLFAARRRSTRVRASAERG